VDPSSRWFHVASGYTFQLKTLPWPRAILVRYFVLFCSAMSLVTALATGFQESGLASEVKARLRSFVAQQLLRPTAAASDVPARDGTTVPPSSSSDALEDGIIFDYLQRSQCSYTLPVFVAERPWSRESQTLAAVGALTARIQQLGSGIELNKRDGSTEGGVSVLRELIDATTRVFASDGPEGAKLRVTERAEPSSSLAMRLVEAEARHAGAAEVADLRASFASQMHDYQRSVDLRAEEEVQVSESNLVFMRNRHFAFHL
jgi:hypothetical protein